MKLELKHIVGYLPYGLKGLVRWEHKNKTHIVHLYGILQNDLQIENPYGGLDYSSYEDFKPILRPLSDLTKEIEFNGVKFAPIEWFEIGDDSNDSQEYDHGNIKLIKTLEGISKYNISNDVLFLPHGVVQKLYEWHFDIHGLIEKGLAIDKNTL